MRLHGTSSSLATARLRIALRLKALEVEFQPVDLGRGEHRQAGYMQINPQGLVPALELAPGREVLTQSLAILEWLEEMWPSPPLLPPDPLGRARVRGFVLALNSEAQPLHSPRTLSRLRAAGLTEGQTQAWARQALTETLDACETLLAHGGGPFCFGSTPGLADVCLVPHLVVARRFGVDLAFPRLLAAEAASLTLPAFQESVSEG